VGIFRSHRKQHNFTQIDNTGAEDSNLPLRGKGLLWYLMTKPDGWEIRNEHLMKTLNIGRDQLRSVIAEMEDAGYLIRIKTQDPETGKFDWVTEVFETPEDCEIWKYRNRDLVDRALIGSTDHKPPKKTRVRNETKTIDWKPTGGQPTPIVITESAMTEFLYSSTVSEPNRCAGIAVASVEPGGDLPTPQVSTPYPNGRGSSPQVEVVTTTDRGKYQDKPVTSMSNGAMGELAEQTAKRREVSRLKRVLSVAELPRNVQGYVLRCNLEQLTYVIEAAIDKTGSYQGDALIRYTVGIFKNVLSDDPEDKKPQRRKLNQKQLQTMTKQRDRQESLRNNCKDYDLEKLYPPIRIKQNGETIDAIFCGYKNDPDWGTNDVSYQTYRNWDGAFYRDSEWRTVKLDEVEIYRGSHPTGVVLE
jgi:hypothetical protein